MGHYSVYNLIGQYIVSNLPERYGGKKIQGVVENIYRDNINKQIELKFKKGKKHIFREPNKIVEEENKIVLIYPGTKRTDDEMLALHKETAFKGHGIEKEIDDSSEIECRVIFQIKDKPKERRRRKTK